MTFAVVCTFTLLFVCAAVSANAPVAANISPAIIIFFIFIKNSFHF